MSLRKACALTWLCVGLAACDPETEEPRPPDAAPPDAAAQRDATVAHEDASASDAGASDASTSDASPARDAGPPADVYAVAVTTFTPGTNAGYGQTKLPDVVLGPPKGGGPRTGSLDVVSLGVGGSIVLDLGERGVVDGEGPDLLVFENAFWPGGDASMVFKDLGEVSVSSDGETWFTFPCDTAGTGEGMYPGCAGWTPTLVYDPTMEPLDPALTGGDAFDLASVAQTSARYVRIRDLSTSGTGTNAGFDLDAVAVVHRGE